MRAYERFLKYIQFDTTSNENNEHCPSSEGQLVFGRYLVEEMKAMGIADAHIDAHGYVYGTIPANREGQSVIGLIAHMDTVDEAPALPMNARIVERYDGGDVTLSEGCVLSPAVFPLLKDAAGEDLIVTDGRTLLGADDKAGVAEIMTLCERLLSDPSIAHGKVCVGFTPDEEIGRGADRFDVAGFGADIAYTVDGSDVGAIEYENFNAASGTVIVHGLNVHPGSAKNKMRNASLVAMEFAGMLPPAETPAHTEGYEGFFHLCDMSGDEERAELHYIIRDHDRAHFESRKQAFERIGAYLNDKYGSGVVETIVKDSYFNMREIMEQHMDVIERAENAYRAVGVNPYAEAIRGGTDGARLSFMGLPCPNLATGGMNYHGRFECIAIQDMDTMVDMLVHLVEVK